MKKTEMYQDVVNTCVSAIRDGGGLIPRLELVILRKFPYIYREKYGYDADTRKQTLIHRLKKEEEMESLQIGSVEDERDNDRPRFQKRRARNVTGAASAFCVDSKIFKKILKKLENNKMD